jgi:hypothetical protein
MYKLSLRRLHKQYCTIVQILGYNIFKIIYIFLLPHIYGKQPDKCNTKLFTSFAKLTESPLFCQNFFVDAMQHFTSFGRSIRLSYFVIKH